LASKKNIPLFKKILYIFYRQNKVIHEMGGNIREVYFGVRGRVLALMTLVMTITIIVLTLAIFYNNRNLIIEEKIAKSRALTKILAGPSEFYLDRDIEMTKDEFKTKLNLIKTESKNFLRYNDDIVKIVLTDEFGRTRYSTNGRDYRKKSIPQYIKKGLDLEEGKLGFHDFALEYEDRKTDKKTSREYRVIISPVFLHNGNVINVLNDYKKYFDKYESASKSGKRKITAALWKKYKEVLGDEFDPFKKIENKAKNKVLKAGDIDFMFLILFTDSMRFRQKRIPKNERSLWSLNWLINQKLAKERAYDNDSATKAKEINDQIKERLHFLAETVENSRRLGALAVIFDMNLINSSSNRNVHWVLLSALIALLAGSIAIFIVLTFNIRNLKKLESWSISVGRGNLDEKIEIKTNDEVGRLGDLSNQMIEEIKLKYNLEKFVSKSTKSMLKNHGVSEKDVGLGVTSRKNLAFIFADVRGFTSFSENETAETVVETLNFYFEMQSNIIKSSKGDIDDYVGDQIMAHFSGAKKAERALDTAIRIMKETRRINEEREKNDLPVFEVGIGVHSGEVVTGNIGSEFRMDFACIGDAVNTTSRLCSSAQPGEILASKHIFDETKKRYKKIDSPAIEVKGKKDRIEIFKVEY